MTMKCTIARPLFALAAALVAVPLAAQESTVVTGKHRPAYQERVSFADLDLRQRSALVALKSRVHRAADRVCRQAEGPFPNNGFPLASALTCSDLTYNGARGQIALAVQRAKAGQQLAMVAIVIAAPQVR